MLPVFLLQALICLFTSYWAYTENLHKFAWILVFIGVINLVSATIIMIDEDYFNF